MFSFLSSSFLESFLSLIPQEVVPDTSAEDAERARQEEEERLRQEREAELFVMLS